MTTRSTNRASSVPHSQFGVSDQDQVGGVWSEMSWTEYVEAMAFVVITGVNKYRYM